MHHQRPLRPLACSLAGFLLLAQACRGAPEDLPPPGSESLGGAFAVYPEQPTPSGPSGSGEEDNPWLHFGEEPSDTGGGQGTTGGGAVGQPDLLDPGAPGSLGAGAAGGQGTGAGGTASEAGGNMVQTAVKPPRLRILGYFESTSAAKLLVVEHIGGGASANCNVEIYSNGGTEPWRTLLVPDGRLPGDREVLCLPDAHHPACNAVSGGSAFNGNDALRLACAGITQDVLGTIGVDPGVAWTGTGFQGEPVSTADSGLWRCANPGSPATPFTAFSLSEWTAWDPNSDPTLLGPSCVPQMAAGGAGGALSD